LEWYVAAWIWMLGVLAAPGVSLLLCPLSKCAWVLGTQKGPGHISVYFCISLCIYNTPDSYPTPGFNLIICPTLVYTQIPIRGIAIRIKAQYLCAVLTYPHCTYHINFSKSLIVSFHYVMLFIHNIVRFFNDHVVL
jgi:hypothetical protein